MGGEREFASDVGDTRLDDGVERIAKEYDYSSRHPLKYANPLSSCRGKTAGADGQGRRGGELCPARDAARAEGLGGEMRGGKSARGGTTRQQGEHEAPSRSMKMKWKLKSLLR